MMSVTFTGMMNIKGMTTKKYDSLWNTKSAGRIPATTIDLACKEVRKNVSE